MRDTQIHTALKIESTLVNAINVHGTETIAKAIGIDRSQISRWKKTHIPKFARFLAFIGYGVEDDDLRRLAKEVAELLIKEMRSYPEGSDRKETN
ncbi:MULTISPECIES: CII family transcriptional regulator [Pantoea]|uniref:Bacteriophage CII protein n=1 Tax=Candidatus Pantoea floridensis TaxID=1938870 RepID=A0A286C006_9GAMM|nr:MULTISPECIES: CII family transcriptional regulator [Pantoea]PIF22223.1 bacteriophage CII protein [Enterobacteriaceae bacterium JKS000233]PXW18495.1 bacteriophage CII protein [Pantoea sp. JKS000250]SOD39730.1 Bacteriophage CII protein [Pantoea floridensis]